MSRQCGSFFALRGTSRLNDESIRCSLLHHSLTPLPHSSVRILHSLLCAALLSTSSFCFFFVLSLTPAPLPHSSSVSNRAYEDSPSPVPSFLSSAVSLPRCSLFSKPDIWRVGSMRSDAVFYASVEGCLHNPHESPHPAVLAS